MRITDLRDSYGHAPFHTRLLVLTGSLILFAGATHLPAQVVFDSAASAATVGGATTLSWSHTVGAGSDRLLIVGVSLDSPTSVSSVTYGSQSLTLVGAQDGQGNQNRMEMWSLLAPSSGTASVTVTIGSSRGFTGGSVSFASVDQTTPLGTFASATNNDTTPTVVVASAAGELVIDTVAARGDTLFTSTGPGQTQRWNLNTGSVTPNDVIGAGSTEPGAASVTMSWTLGSAKSWAIGAVPVRPAGVVIPTETPTSTPTNTPTDTPTNTPTDTPTNTPTDTPTNTPTNTPGGPTNTPTNTPTDTPTNTPTNTPGGPTNTATPTPTTTLTPTGPAATATPTSTPTVTGATPTFTAIPGPGPGAEIPTLSFPILVLLGLALAAVGFLVARRS